MPLIFRPWILRRDLRAEPDSLYIFGDNEMRRGLGGQAREMRGEPNALGIATKRAPGMEPGDFWRDAEFGRLKLIIDADLARAFDQVRAGGIAVMSNAGIGTDRAELPTRAPRVYQYLRGRLVELHAIGRRKAS